MLKHLNQHHSLFNKEFLKGPSWVLFSSSFILLLSVPASLIPWLNIISTLHDTQLFISFTALKFSQTISHLETTIDLVSTWMSANLLSLNQSKTEFLLIGLPQQISKISEPTLIVPANVTITLVQSARNLGVIFDSSLTMSDHISTVSKSCFLAIRDLRRIRSTLDNTTAQTIAKSLIHSKVDY